MRWIQAGYINVEKENNIVLAKNLYTNDFKDSITYVSSNEEIKSYTGDKDFFIGNKTIKNPDGINKVSLNNEPGLGKKSCIAIELEIELGGYESKEIVLLLGAETSV